MDHVPITDLIAERQQIRLAVVDAADVAHARMADTFDDRHTKPPRLHGSVFIRYSKSLDQGYHLPGSSKLSVLKAGPFKIKRRVRAIISAKWARPR